MQRSLITLLLPFIAVAMAQGHGGWTVESYQDAYSFTGLGSLWLEPHEAPAGLTNEEALLVVGCDASSPNGFELLVQIGDHLIALPDGDDGDLSMMVRFDQEAILYHTWFLADGFFGQEIVAYFDLNDELFEGLARASNLALRVQADAGRGVPELTLQYDVRGFATALNTLVCGEEEAWDWDDDWMPDMGSWSFDGDFGMLSHDVDGGPSVIAIYCSELGDGNGFEVDLGDYELQVGDPYEVTFRSGSVDFLSASATVNGYGAAQLDTDLSEDRLLRYLRGVTDVTVTLRPTAGGEAMSYTVGNQDFMEAVALLSCAPLGR